MNNNDLSLALTKVYCSCRLLWWVTQTQEKTTPTTKITQHGCFIIRVHYLVYSIHRRVCCYSNGEPPFHHSFYKEQKPSYSQHVLGYKLNRG